MKLWITPTVVRGYSRSSTSPSLKNVFGWTKIFRGWFTKRWFSAARGRMRPGWSDVPTHQLLLKNQVPDLAVPAVKWRSQLRVEGTGTSTVRGALANLEVNQKLACCLATMRQDLLAVDLSGDVLVGQWPYVCFCGNMSIPGHRGSPACRLCHGPLRERQCPP